MSEAGKMDRRIRIEQAVEGPVSDDGQTPVTWTLMAEVWAEVRPLRGDELWRAQQLVAKADVLFRIRYPAALNPLPNPDETIRIVYEGEHYDIRHVTEIGRREGMEILAEVRAEKAA